MEGAEIKRKPIDWKKMVNKMAIPPAGKNMSIASKNELLKSVDYLKELRVKREQDERDGVKSRRVDDFERFLNDPTLNDYEKLNIIKKRAEKMEERARMEEKLMKVGINSSTHASSMVGHSHVEKTIAVNDMYIEAITAKLRLLDQI